MAGLIGVANNSFAADVKLGLAAALSGPAAKYGVAIKNGFTLAVDEINAKGGINGDKLILVADDEQGKKEARRRAVVRDAARF